MNKTKIKEAIQKYGENVCKEVKKQWDNLSSIDGNSEINFEIDENKTENSIIGRFSATGQKAWIAEYGKGSKLDKNNAYLKQYQNSSRYNPLRQQDGTIVGRPLGMYLDLDNNPHISTGKLAGRNLEKTGIKEFKPIRPYKVIDNTINKKNGLRALFELKLKNIVKDQIKIEVKRK